MLARLFLVYAVVECMALLGLAAAIGVGWTLLVLSAVFVLGIVAWAPLAGWQLRTQVMQLRSGLTDPGRALGDGALVTLASGMVLVPGLVTTALGLLMLLPPVRSVAGPGLTAIAMRRFGVRVPLLVNTGATNDFDGRDYIDGEVIDVIDGDPTALPDRAYRRT